jgi:uncharacterized protein YbjQ (UPF0145 family)
MKEILLTTQDNLAEYKIIKTLGLVRGNTVRSRNVANNMLAGIRTIFGGELPELTKAVAESREQALDRLKAHALELGADAVVCIRLITTEVGNTSSEVLAYGTAVKLDLS